jgi:hypothetical protein
VPPYEEALARRMEGPAARGRRGRRVGLGDDTVLELETMSGAGGNAIPASTEGLGSVSLQGCAR